MNRPILLLAVVFTCDRPSHVWFVANSGILYFTVYVQHTSKGIAKTIPNFLSCNPLQVPNFRYIIHNPQLKLLKKLRHLGQCSATFLITREHQAGTSKMERTSRCTCAFWLADDPSETIGYMPLRRVLQTKGKIGLLTTYLKLATYRGLQLNVKDVFSNKGITELHGPFENRNI